jgi:hypothetical protein
MSFSYIVKLLAYFSFLCVHISRHSRIIAHYSLQCLLAFSCSQELNASLNLDQNPFYIGSTKIKIQKSLISIIVVYCSALQVLY